MKTVDRLKLCFKESALSTVPFFTEKMLKNELRDNELYKLLKPAADGLGMTIVEVQKNICGPAETKVVITVMKNDGETSIDDLETFHRAVQSLLEITIGRDILSMETGTPGLERNFRDYAEFEIFRGRQVKVYSTAASDWISGRIGQCTQDAVVLTDDDGNEVSIEYKDIHKARLDYKWIKNTGR